MKIVKLLLAIGIIGIFLVGGSKVYDGLKSFVESEDVQYTLGVLRDYSIGALANIGVFEYESNEIVGKKLYEIGDFSISKYIDITIPQEHMVGKIECDINTTDEAIAISSNDALLTIYLEKSATESTLEAARIKRDELILMLSSEYSNLTITCSDVKERIATLNIKYPENDLRTNMAVVGLGEKTLIITNSYKVENILDAENYYASLLGEVINSLQERGI